MKTIGRYVAREHLGPFVFALLALTSLMMLNLISKQFGDLVGKGIPIGVIVQFFLLTLPLTLELTVPMSVLVAVLYAYSRLAAENEVTAFMASGVSPARLVRPALWGGLIMSLGLLVFNDQVVPWANHELKTLQGTIAQTKPTFLLKEQIINPVAEGRLYLKADHIDRGSGRMRSVVIYDMSNTLKSRTVYADSGTVAFSANMVDLDMTLYNGVVMEIDARTPAQLNRLFYKRDRLRVQNVGSGQFKTTKSDSLNKGDREMGICEMERHLGETTTRYKEATAERDAVRAGRTPPATRPHAPPGGLGALYCWALTRLSHIATAGAQTPPALNPHDHTPAAQTLRETRLAEAELRLGLARAARDRYLLEINKKFSLAAACLIFCLLAPPLAFRYPNGGVGLVLGVSLAIFALYYVGLIGGEALSNHGVVPPALAMWGTNALLTAIGIVLQIRMSRTMGNRRG